MNRRIFETLLLTLESTPALLSRAAAALPGAEARRRPAAGGFSFVESVWHLADLEREGYGVRIRRILAEDGPALLNFDGNRVAQERGYQNLDLERGLTLFARARALNLETLRRLTGARWKRSGALEGVGRVTLADIARMMSEHDRSHDGEITDLIAELRGSCSSSCSSPSAAGRPHPTSAVA